MSASGRRTHPRKTLGVMSALALLAFSALSVQVGSVQAASYGVKGTLGSGLCVLNGGTWANATQTCQLSVSWTVVRGSHLSISSNTTLAVSGSLNIYGSMQVKKGTLLNLAGGTVSINGSLNILSGLFENNGTVDNLRSGGIHLLSKAKMTNDAGGTISNSAGITANALAVLRNLGVIVNNAKGRIVEQNHAFLINGGIISNTNGSRLIGDNQVVFQNLASGVLVNNGTLVMLDHTTTQNNGTFVNQNSGTSRNENHGTFVNLGSFTNYGTVADRNHATFVNGRTLANLLGAHFRMENHGLITNLEGGSLINDGNMSVRRVAQIIDAGSMTNSPSGILRIGLVATFTVNATGTLANFGLVRNHGTIDNYGTIHNTVDGGVFSPAGTINNYGTID